MGSLQYRERCSSKYHESEARFYRTRIHGSCRCSDSEQHVISGSREGKMETLLCKNWTSGLRVCCNVRSRVLRPCHTYVVFSRLSLFLIYLLRGLTRVTYTTKYVSTVSLSCVPHSQQYHSNIQSQTRTPTLEHRYFKRRKERRVWLILRTSERKFWRISRKYTRIFAGDGEVV